MPPRNRAIASSGRCVALRPMRWSGGASSPRSRSSRSRRRARWAPRFDAGDRVDLVDDDVLDAAQDLAGLAGQQQVQALRRRDEDVRWVAGQLATLIGGRVAGPARDGDPRWLVAESLGRQADAGQRRPQVALDVVGQRLERRDVQDADVPGRAAGGRRARVAGEPVQAPQEGGQGLAAARRGVDERVAAAADGGPALRLGLGRCVEARLEPFAHGRRERRERVDGDGTSRDEKYRRLVVFRPDVLFSASPHSDRSSVVEHHPNLSTLRTERHGSLDRLERIRADDRRRTRGAHGLEKRQRARRPSKSPPSNSEDRWHWETRPVAGRSRVRVPSGAK